MSNSSCWLVGPAGYPSVPLANVSYRRVMNKQSTHHSGLVWGWSGMIYGTNDQDKHKKRPTNIRLWPWPWGSGADVMLARGVFPRQSRHGVSCSCASLGSSSIDVLASHSESAGSSMGPRSWGILTALTTEASAIGGLPMVSPVDHHFRSGFISLAYTGPAFHCPPLSTFPPSSVLLTSVGSAFVIPFCFQTFPLPYASPPTPLYLSHKTPPILTHC